MNQLLEFPHGSHLYEDSDRTSVLLNPSKILHREASCLSFRMRTKSARRKWLAVAFRSPVSCKIVDRAESSLQTEDKSWEGEKMLDFPHVQTLRNFPKEEIFRKVVMVRFDSIILLQGNNEEQPPETNAFRTIKYLYEVAAKVILVGSWRESANFRLPSGAYPSTESVADFLSSMLEIKVVPMKFSSGYKHSEDSQYSGILLFENLFHFKGELANCSKFSKELATDVDVIVNDAFSQSHRVLASNVGVASFCHAYIAGFYFEECLTKLKKLIKTSERPYMAIIGGGNFADKAVALKILASTCDGLIFVGNMGFQIMHAIGIPVPLEFVELQALKKAISIVEFAKSRNIPLLFPKDIWCVKNHDPQKLELFSANSIIEGWQPIDIGPSSLQEMVALLSKCKRILWIGPMEFRSSIQDKFGTFRLAEALDNLHQSCCNITFVGKMQFEELLRKTNSFSKDNFVENAAVVWEALKGRKLPGLISLDRAYPFHVQWNVIYGDPVKPLVVDVGSGNGLFLFGMARRRNDMNFLGLELNVKLVDRCMYDVDRLGMQNVHFLATNATTSFRSIVSSYPGELVLVSIQCPNPDFNKLEYRWRMLQRSLVEAITDVLMLGGKVFLQSDVESVCLKMKKEFIEYSNGKLVVADHAKEDTAAGGQWLKENPFGVPSDWEQHTLDRGDPMYRLLLSKVGGMSRSK